MVNLEQKLSKNKTIWDDLLIKTARKPLKTLIWIFGIIFAIKLTNSYANVDISTNADSFRDIGVIICLSWFVLRVIREYEKQTIKNAIKENTDVTTVTAITKLLKATMVITAILMLLQTFGISIGGVLAFGGIGGIAIGFAAKDLLANFFGAMMIYLDRPFTVGDWIRSPDRNIEGTVEDIGWRLTHIRTFDKRMLYIPNAIFSSIAIENPSRMSHRRINETIGVRYEDVTKIPKILQEIKDMLKNHKEIDESQTLMVNLNQFNEYSVDFFIYTFTHTTK